MTKKFIKKLTALCLSVSLCFGIAAPMVSAKDTDALTDTEQKVQTALESEEALPANGEIYAMLDAKGSIQKMIMTDLVTETLKKTGVLTDAEESDKKDALPKIVDVDGNVMAYKGDLTSDLPIDISVVYTLDGHPIAPEDLAGKNGHVTIRYTYTNHQQETVIVDGTAFTVPVPTVAITGMILNNEHFSNIKISGGKSLDDGKKTTIMGLAMPGMKNGLNMGLFGLDFPEEVIIEADARNFELGNSITIAVKDIFSSIDASKINSVADMFNAADQLSDGMHQLLNGSDQLAEGMNTLANQSETLADGVNALTEGSAAARDGAMALSDGIAQLQGGIHQLSDGLDQLSANSETLNTGAESLYNGYLQMIDAVLRSVIEIDPYPFPGLTAENYAEVLTMIGTQIPQLQPKTEEFKAALDGARTFCGGLKTYTDGVDSAAISVQTQLVPGAGHLAQGSTDLTKGLGDLNNGLQTMQGKMPDLKSGIKQLNDGTQQLASGLKDFNQQGIHKIVSFMGDGKSLVNHFKAMIEAAKVHPVLKNMPESLNGKINVIYRTEAVK